MIETDFIELGDSNEITYFYFASVIIIMKIKEAHEVKISKTHFENPNFGSL